jgi:hypothetical protein
MAIAAQTTVFSLDELLHLLDQLEQEPIPPDQFSWRQATLDAIARVRERLTPIPVTIEQLIRDEQEGTTFG